MGHSIQRVRGKYLTFKDIDLYVVLHLLIQKAKQCLPGSTHLGALVQRWREACVTSGPGCIELELEAQISNHGENEAAVRLLRAVATDLQGVEIYSLSELQTGWLVQDVKIGLEYPAKYLREVVNTLIEVCESEVEQ